MPDRQHERLKGLMLVRILLVTAFLGSAVAVDITNFADLSEARNLSLLGLIVVTYLLTIGYAVAMTRGMSTSVLAYLQLFGDLFITAVLTLVTGGFDSLFLFFFHLTIINAAIVAGHRAALVMAAITAGCMGYFAAITLGWLPHPVLDEQLPGVTMMAVVYEVLVNSLAGFLIAVLAGQLAHRLGRATQQLERHKSDIADLQALNENILSSISSGLVTTDNDGIIIFFNRAAEQITGLDSREVLGHPLEQLFPGLAAAEADIDKPAGRLETTFQRRDGTEVFLGFSVSRLLDSEDNKIGRIVIFRDLTEVKQLEARMKRSERLAAIGELSAAIAHEIRNPLASISGSVEMLDVDEQLDDDTRMLTDIIVREVERLDHLINEFLEYSQPRSLEPSAHRVIPILEELLQLFEAREQTKHLQVNLEVPSGRDPVVDIDAEAFRQILWNLLQNAVEAIGEPRGEGHHLDLQLRVEDDENRVLVAVEDDGEGLDATTRERIFEPFFTTKEEGTGLGLATTYRLIQEQGGLIDVTAPESLEGARFEIRLPLIETKPPAESSESHQQKALPA